MPTGRSVLFVLLALASATAAVPQNQDLPPGHLDPAPVLAAATDAIGADNLTCVAISGSGYAGMVGLQRPRVFLDT